MCDCEYTRALRILLLCERALRVQPSVAHPKSIANDHDDVHRARKYADSPQRDPPALSSDLLFRSYSCDY